MDGRKLAEARVRKRLTQEKLAERLNVGVSTVQRWERGQCTPQALHLQQICETLELAAEEFLEKECTPSVQPPLVPPALGPKHLQAFMKQDLTMHLQSLTTLPYRTYHDVQSNMIRILKDYDKMTSKNLHLNRRKALLRLITLPFTLPGIAAALSSEETPSANVSKDLLAQCAVSLTACWELRKSSEYQDFVLAFEGVSAYLPALQRIVRDSSPYRQEAANLVIQCLLLTSQLAQHTSGLAEATHYAQQALPYCEPARNISLHLRVLERLAVVHFYSKRYQQAFQAIEQTIPMLKKIEQKKLPVSPHLQARMHGELAVNLSRNGMNGEVHLDQASILLSEVEKDCPIYATYDTSDFLLDAGTTYMLQGESTKAIETFSQAIDPTTLALKMPWTELGRVETINAMTMAHLKVKDKDMEQAMQFWTAGINGAKALHSRQRFNEALTAYEIMEYIWPYEIRIKELRDLTQHW